MPPYLVCLLTALSRRHTMRSFNFPRWPSPAPVTASPLLFRATTRPLSKPPDSSWGRLPSSRRTILRPVGGRETSSIMTTPRSEEHTSELQSRLHLVCRLLLEKKKTKKKNQPAAGAVHTAFITG